MRGCRCRSHIARVMLCRISARRRIAPAGVVDQLHIGLAASSNVITSSLVIESARCHLMMRRET